MLFTFLLLRRFSEAEAIFVGGASCKTGGFQPKDVVTKFGDASCFALQIMAKVYGDTERTSQVKRFFSSIDKKFSLTLKIFRRLSAKRQL